MIPLREPVARVVMQAGLMQFLRKIAAVLGLTLASARDLARSVLTDEEADDRDHDDGDSARPQ